MKLTTRPLFTGYIFAQFDANAAAQQILRVYGVVQILSVDQKPVAISDDEIAILRRVVESPAPVSPCAYVVGETVRVKTGPFAGVDGVITRIRGAATLTIPIEILGRAVSVAIDVADVETV